MFLAAVLLVLLSCALPVSSNSISISNSKSKSNCYWLSFSFNIVSPPREIIRHVKMWVCGAWTALGSPVYDRPTERVFVTKTVGSGYVFILGPSHYWKLGDVGYRTVVVRTREEANAARVFRPGLASKNELLSIALHRPKTFTDDQTFGFMRLAGLLEDRFEVERVMRYCSDERHRLYEMLEKYLVETWGSRLQILGRAG